MAEAIDIYGAAFKNGSATMMARIVGAAGANIAQADIAAIRYSVYMLDDQNPDARAPVGGHSQVSLPVYQVIFNSLQSDATWTVDAVGYNFRRLLTWLALLCALLLDAFVRAKKSENHPAEA